MPAPAEFDAIARSLLALAVESGNLGATTFPDLVAQLRWVWNARGAADLEALSDAMPVIQREVLEETIKGLDR